MNNGNIKKRDVMSFDKFVDAYDRAKDVVQLKDGKDAHPQTHKIEAEGLWSRHDANPYNAFGIPVGKDANINDRVIPGHTAEPPQEKPHDGQDPLPGSKIVKGQDIQDPQENKAQAKAADDVAASAEDSSEIIKKK